LNWRLNKILCIDDDADILEIVKVSLEVFGGYQLQTCSGGSEGLSQAATWQPDLIITDVMMPDLDGIETFRLLRENPVTAQIPVFFMTARVENSHLNEYISLGTASIIQKPFDVTKLAAQVNDAWCKLESV
jgi:two-component system OmpR family response regulator